MTHIFNDYGRVTPTELYDLKQKVETMQFSPQEPVDTLITEIDDLADIADIAGSPITDLQRVEIGYIVLQRCKPFKTGLREWNERPAADRTWANFKTHFRDAQISLRKTGDITIEEGLNHTAVVDMVAEGARTALAEHVPPKEEQANNTTETKLLQHQIQEMRQLIDQMTMNQVALQFPFMQGQPNQHPQMYTRPYGMNNQQGYPPKPPRG